MGDEIEGRLILDTAIVFNVWLLPPEILMRWSQEASQSWGTGLCITY